MTRERFKTKEYFDIYIEEEKEELKDSIKWLSDERVLKERLYLVRESIFEQQLLIIIAMYSRGDSIDVIASKYKEVIESWKNICSPEWIEYYYTENLWFVSLGIMLEMGNEVLEIIERKLKDENINDWLLNFLLSKGEKSVDQIEGQLIMPEKYQTLKNTICSLDKSLLMRYLEKEWYANCKDYGWYDSHKQRRHRENLYFGYWCFEAGSVVKLLNWDDSDIANQQYYPYELVHYKK